MRSVMMFAAALSLGSALAATPTMAQKKYGPGVTDSEILLGQTMPYSGPVSAYGSAGRAMSAYFDKINAEGGINGRKIRLLSLDDGFTPAKSLEQVRRLVEQDNVLAITGSLGTGTNLAVYKYLNQKKVPQLFVITGFPLFAAPDDHPWTMALLPSYASEGKAYAQHILETVKDPRIAILQQNDEAGKMVTRSFREGLGPHADKLVVAEAFAELTDPTVDSQILSLAASDANVVFFNVSPKAAAQAIRKAYDIGWHPVRYLPTPSANVAATLQPAGFEKSKGVISATYFKDPTDEHWKGDAGYKGWAAWMKQYYPAGSIADAVNVTGTLAAQTMIQVLKQCGDDLTRENVLRQATSIKNLELPMLLPGVKLNTSSDDYKLIDQLQMQRFNGERWELFGKLIEG